MMGNFQIVPFLEYLVFFGAVFIAQNYSKSFLEWILTCFSEFKFLTQSDDFAGAIGFALWAFSKCSHFSNI